MGGSAPYIYHVFVRAAFVESLASDFNPLKNVVFVSPSSEPMLQKCDFRVYLDFLYQCTSSKHTGKHSMSISPPGRRDQDETRRDVLDGRQWGDKGGESTLIQVWKLEEERLALRHLDQPMENHRAEGIGQKWPTYSSHAVLSHWLDAVPEEHGRGTYIHMWPFPNFVWLDIFTLHFNSLQCGFASFPMYIHTHIGVYTYLYT